MPVAVLPICAHCPLATGAACPVCTEPLPESGNRLLAIPWLGGRRRLVHSQCASEVEAQATLAIPKGRDAGQRDSGEQA